METKSYFGLVKLFFKEVFSFSKEILFEGGENELLKSVGVKKGLKNGLKYILILLILPIKIAKYFFNPDFRSYFFIEKMTTPFLFLGDVFGGNNNNVIAKTYESFLEKLKSGSTTELKANIADIDVFKNLFVIRKFLTGILFVILVVVGAIFGFNIISDFAEELNLYGLVGGVIASGGSSLIFGSLGIYAILEIIIGLIVISFYGFLLYTIIKIIVYIVRDSYILPSEQMQNFLFELIEYTHKKTKQIYGEELSSKALFAVSENFILQDKKIDLLQDEELTAKEDFLKIENLMKNEKEA